MNTYNVIISLLTGMVIVHCKAAEITDDTHPCDVHKPDLIVQLINEEIIPALENRFELCLNEITVPVGAGFDKSSVSCNDDLGSPRDCCSIAGWTVFFGYESFSDASGFDISRSTRFDLTGIQRIITFDGVTLVAAFRISNYQVDFSPFNEDGESRICYSLAESCGIYTIQADVSRLIQK